MTNNKEESVKLPYRQGDVLIVPVNTIPDGLSEVPRDNGRIVLAYGEVTGHAHAIDDPTAVLLAEDVADIENRFLRILDEARVNPPIYRHPATGAVVLSDGETIVPDGYEFTGEYAPEKVPGALLTHEEHGPITLPPGNHRIGRQREYAPEANTLVAD